MHTHFHCFYPLAYYGILGRWKTTSPKKDPFLSGVQTLTAAIAYGAPPLKRPRACLCLLILSFIQQLFIEALSCVSSCTERGNGWDFLL